MLPSPCYVFSDAHLGVRGSDVEAATLAFLRHVARSAGSLVINGDLFEFWFEWTHVIPRRGFRVLAALADVREAGVPIAMLAGNHDCWGGDVLRRDVGVDYRLTPLTGVIAGWHAWIEHGDGLRHEDAPYRRLRAVIRHPLAKRAFRMLPPDAASGLAHGSSHASRMHSAADEGAGLRNVAFTRLESTPGLELVIYGHSHVAHLERAAGGGVYANPGPWLTDQSYLVVTDDRIALRRWSGSAEGSDLHVLDRAAKKALPDA